MAVAQMAKVVIVSHRMEASELLEALQREGICHVLNADEAMVSKDFPELGTLGERPREVEGLLGRLGKSIAFLGNFAEARKGLASVLSPRVVIDEKFYSKIVSNTEILKTVDACEQIENAIEKIKGEIENLNGTLEMLGPCCRGWHCRSSTFPYCATLGWRHKFYANSGSCESCIRRSGYNLGKINVYDETIIKFIRI